METSYYNRKYIIGGIFILVGLIYIFRLLYIQVIESSYKISASNNILRYVTQYPARGLIFDRNGVLLVANQAAYDLMVIPRQVQDFDTTELCNILEINRQDLIFRLRNAQKYSYYKPSVFMKQLSARRYAILQEKLYKFPGFFVQTRTLRSYPQKIAAHVLGYVGEVNKKIIKQNPYYKPGDYIGISGIEKYYEKELRGRKGVKIYLVDVHNRIKGSFKDGAYDTLAVIGKNITTTLDASLQKYGERLMQNKKGSIVAIEPSTGEILALISSPAYNPELLVGRMRAKNYFILSNDSLNPLFNRALMAKYPPGSIFKIVQALIGLQEGVITENTGLPCNKQIIDCHNHPPPTNLRKAIQYSCNPYFFVVYKLIIEQGKFKSRFEDSRIGLHLWRKYVLSFGFGQRLKIDLPGVNSGFIPDIDFYDRWYGLKRWAFSTIYSNAIGQGEIEVIPLQMANLAAIIANEGYYYTPHIVKAIQGQEYINKEYLTKHKVLIDREYFKVVKDAMEAVVNEAHGTAFRARIKDITVCGKTGTAQNPHGEDHSVFIAFAPRDTPKIAIAVYVENSGFGGTWAAPIASLMIEKYLTDTITNKFKEQRILNANFLQ